MLFPMNKDQLKETYVNAGYKALLNTVSFYLPTSVAQKDAEEFEANVKRAIAEMEARAEEYVKAVDSF